jgi:hypothetical protein
VADDEKLTWLLGILRDECKKLGRDAGKIEVTAGRTVPDADGVKRLTDLGVSRFILPPPAFDADGLTKGLEAYGQMIAKF